LTTESYGSDTWTTASYPTASYGTETTTYGADAWETETYASDTFTTGSYMTTSTYAAPLVFGTASYETSTYESVNATPIPVQNSNDDIIFAMLKPIRAY